MKLNKVLTVADTVYPLVFDETRLDLKNPGRAAFTIQSDKAVTGIVSLDIGYNNDPLQRFFYGYIESCTQSNTNEYKLFAREFSYVLKEPLRLNILHCSLKELVTKIAQLTGLKFKLPNAPYIENTTAFFYNIGNGYNALDYIGEVFEIDDYLWQQQGNGEIYIGSWQDSYWGDKPILQIPNKFFTDFHNNGMATIGAIPKIRPGARINSNSRIQMVTLKSSDMVIQWTR